MFERPLFAELNNVPGHACIIHNFVVGRLAMIPKVLEIRRVGGQNSARAKCIQATTDECVDGCIQSLMETLRQRSPVLLGTTAGWCQCVPLY